MKKNLLKSCLVAIGMVAGTMGAWADAGDVTTNIDIDFSNAIENETVVGKVGSMSIGQNSAYPTEIANGILVLGNGTHSVSIPEANYAGTKDIVTVSFDLAFGKLSKKNVGFYFEDEKGSKIGEFSFCPYAGSLSVNDFGIETSDFYYVYNTVIWDRRATFTVVYNYATKTITTSVLNHYGNKTTTHDVVMQNTNPIAKFCVTSNYNNKDRRCQFDNLKITTTEGDYSSATKTVTVKFVTEDNTEIPNAEIPENTTFNYIVDTNSEFVPTYPTTFMTDDYVYTYVSGGDKITVTDDVTMTLVYKKENREKVNVALNCMDTEGNLLETRSIATDYPIGKDIAYGINKYIIKDGNLYEADILGTAYYVATTQASSTPIEVRYKKINVEGTPIFFADFGDTPSTDATSTEYLRASGGQTESSNKEIVLVPANTLSAGIYTFEVRHYKNRAPKFNVGETEFGVCSTGNNAGVMVTSIFENVLVAKGEKISVTPGGSSSWTDNMDYVLVTKVGDAKESVTVSAAKYATYVTKYNVTVPADVKVYAVKVNEAGTGIVKTEVAEGTVVPAGTGILVNAEEAGNYDFAVTNDDAQQLTDNELLASDGEGVTSDGETCYALGLLNGKVGFALVAKDVVIPAGKAYLKVSKASGAKFISMDGELTGINNVNIDTVAEKAPYYTLEGVKTLKPTKGVFIHNGKKVIIK